MPEVGCLYTGELIALGGRHEVDLLVDLAVATVAVKRTEKRIGRLGSEMEWGALG